MSDLAEVLVARESERRQALVQDDMARLADLLAEDLVHVHTTGIVHDKAMLLEHAGTTLRFLDVMRSNLKIRALSETVAVMTGDMVNLVQRRGVDEQVRVEAFVTQVWRRESGGVWRIASFQATKKSTGPAR